MEMANRCEAAAHYFVARAYPHQAELGISLSLFARSGRRVHPLQTHRNRYGQHPLPVFIANLDGDFAGVIPWQQIATDARCRCRSFSLRSVEVGEL